MPARAAQARDRYARHAARLGASADAAPRRRGGTLRRASETIAAALARAREARAPR